MFSSAWLCLAKALLCTILLPCHHASTSLCLYLGHEMFMTVILLIVIFVVVVVVVTTTRVHFH